MRYKHAMRYVQAKISEEDLWQGYQANALFVQATGDNFAFVKTDAPKQPPKHRVEATIKDWISDVRYGHLKTKASMPQMATVSNEELDEMIFGTRNVERGG